MNDRLRSLPTSITERCSEWHNKSW